jgi:hypothetical protein
MDRNETILSKEVVIESKKFYFDLKQNDRGKFLRITEKHVNRKSRIFIPASGINDIISIFKEIGENID